jgi:IS5 family transposase
MKKIDTQGFNLIFKMSIELHGSLAQEPSVLINTTVQEKNITYPTDAKLAIKIINRLNKLAKHHNIQQRRTYVNEVKNSCPWAFVLALVGRARSLFDRL